MIRTSRTEDPTYGNDAILDNQVDGLAASANGRQAIKHVGPTGSDFVDGVLTGLAWKGNGITYSFPDSKSDYHYKNEPSHGFGEVSGKIKAAAEFILDTSYGSKANDGFAVEGFTKLHTSKGSDTGATIRYGESSAADPTAYGYYPNPKETGGDIWFGNNAKHYSNAVSGNYEFATVIHETGHALGLKHGHEAGFGNPAIPDQWDSLEYSVMTYNSYAGDDATGYTNENFGYPQTYMMADVAALQHMYGANFDVNSGSTTYSWKPNSGNTFVNGKVAINAGGDNIFATIWDGGGKHDKYNLSAYSNNVQIDLHAGSYSDFKQSQLANLGKFDPGTHIASGNIYNALQYNGDNRSLIEDAVGGKGNDTIDGNQVSNRLVGGLGNDTLSGYEGKDILLGGKGDDMFVFQAGWGKDTVQDFGGHDRVDLRSFLFSSFDQVLALAENDGKDVTLVFGDGDNLTIHNMHKGDLHAADFML